ncbi:MAG: hypothetical protein WC679_12805 [Bacteroidales bacterium]|jgi:hypothetical protein
MLGEDLDWAKDEAHYEAEHYVITVLQSHDERDGKLVKKLDNLVSYWADIFEDDSLLLIFIEEFNKKVPDFCQISEEQKAEYIKQTDLF